MNVQPKTERVKEMFDHIAPTYDRLNHILSLSIDKIWRRRVVRRVLKLDAKEILFFGSVTGAMSEACAVRVLSTYMSPSAESSVG